MTSEIASLKKIVRGYDPQAVEEAWADLQTQIDHTMSANKELRLHLNSLEEQNTQWLNRLNSYTQTETILRETLLEAQRMSHQITEDAKKRAQSMLTQAHDEHAAILKDAQVYWDQKAYLLQQELLEKRSTLEILRQEIESLSQQRQDMNTVVTSALERLSDLRSAIFIPR